MPQRRLKDPQALDDIRQKLRAGLPDLGERYHIRSLGVFGSYARGQARRGSDLDLLVEFHQAPSLFTFTRLQRELSEAAGVRVDLVMKSALKPEIGRRILNEVAPV